MADPKDKSLLEKAEDAVSDSYDEQRKQIPPWDDVGRVKHDVEVGLMKGVYGGVKSLLSGAIDLVRLAPGVDPAFQVQVAQKAWPVAVKLAKETYISQYGTPAEKQDQGERTIAFAKEVYAGFEKDWKKAEGTDGKRTELASKWVGRVGFEVGALFVGAGEAKAAIKGGEIVGDLGKLKEGAAILEDVTQTCKTVEMSSKEVLAEIAAKELEAARKAKTVEIPAVKDPSAAKTVEMPAVKDASTAKTVEMPAVKDPVTVKMKAPAPSEPLRAPSRPLNAPKKLSGGKYADKGIGPMSQIGQRIDRERPVKIFNTSELESRRVVAHEGKLVYAESGKPVTTTKETIYVMDKHGNVYVDESQFGSVHHSSLAGGEEPVAGGHITTKEDGTLVELTEQTGHYGENQPLGRSELVKSELGSQGVDTSATQATPFGK